MAPVSAGGGARANGVPLPHTQALRPGPRFPVPACQGEPRLCCCYPSHHKLINGCRHFHSETHLPRTNSLTTY